MYTPCLAVFDGCICHLAGISGVVSSICERERCMMLSPVVVDKAKVRS